MMSLDQLNPNPSKADGGQRSDTVNSESFSLGMSWAKAFANDDVDWDIHSRENPYIYIYV